MATCSSCGKSFSTEKELQAHDKKMHRSNYTGSAERMGDRVRRREQSDSPPRTRTVRVTEEEWKMIKKARESGSEGKAKKERRRETGKAY